MYIFREILKMFKEILNRGEKFVFAVNLLGEEGKIVFKTDMMELKRVIP